MKGHFAQFKRILKFNLADRPEHITEMSNGRVKKKIKSTKKRRGKNYILSKALSLKRESWGGRCQGLCWALRSEMRLLPLIKAFISVLGLREGGMSRTQMNNWPFLSSESFNCSPIFKSHFQGALLRSY